MMFVREKLIVKLPIVLNTRRLAYLGKPPDIHLPNSRLYVDLDIRQKDTGYPSLEKKKQWYSLIHLKG
jgi:hypothetical protein